MRSNGGKMGIESIFKFLGHCIAFSSSFQLRMGITSSFLVGLQNSGGPGGGDFNDRRDFFADEGGEFSGVRDPEFDQIAVLAGHIMDLLDFRDGGQRSPGFRARHPPNGS